MFSAVATDPVVVAATALALAFGLGYVIGRINRTETIFTFTGWPEGLIVQARANYPASGRADNETPNAHVDL